MEMLIRTRVSKDKCSHPQCQYREVEEEDNWYLEMLIRQNSSDIDLSEISRGNDNVVVNYPYYTLRKVFRSLS